MRTDSGQSPRAPAGRIPLALAFFAIYFIWGSTYLAIRYAVETIPPLLTAGSRHLIAGSVLWAWARARGARMRPEEWKAALIVGALFFLIGHGTLHWAEQVVPSGLAAVLLATEPIWIAVMFAVTRPDRRPTWLGVAGFGLGLAGVIVLVRPEGGAAPASLLGTLVVIAGAVSWSAGIVYADGAVLPRDAILRTSATLLCGAVMLLVCSTAIGELHAFRPSGVTLRSVLGLSYLIVFGTLVAFTAYMWLLERVSPTLVATHTYVNPIVAVLLGWALAGEALSSSLLLATVLILLGIAMIGRGQRRVAHPVPAAPTARPGASPSGVRAGGLE